jgi:oligopeptidase B
MAHARRGVPVFGDVVLRDRLSRREIVRQAVTLGLSLPILAVLPHRRAAAQTVVTPPDAPRRPQIYAFPGGLGIDPYAWLENRDDPEVIAYLEAENAYTEAVMAPTKALQEEIYQELLGRIKQTDASVATPWNGYLYYTRSEEGKDYDILCRKPDRLDAPEQVLLDLNVIAEAFLALGQWLPSPDNRYLAYGLDETGDEYFTTYVWDMTTGQVVDQLPHSQYFQWANDSRTLFYCKQHPEWVWPYAHYRHVVGEDAASDVLLYEEPVAQFELSTSASKDRTYIFLYSETVDTNEIRYLPADEPTAEPTLFAPRRPGVRSFLEHHGEEFLVRTDEDAPNYKLMAAPVANPVRGTWRELVPHRDDAVLDGVEVFEHHLALFGREDGLKQIWVGDLTRGATTPVPFDEAVFTVAPGQNWEFATTKLRYLYSSPVTPDSDFEYDMATGERILLKQMAVLGGHDPDRYVTERLFAPAPDGTRVPISLVYLREAPAATPPGPRPLRLDGYGAYGLTTEPWFSISRLTLINRGITFAQAHVRGGGEFGRRWWEGGRLLSKWNTFTDFIACAEHLIAQGYTAPDRLFARGGSAGGLLMGVVATQRPDLFQAVHAEVPSVDLIGHLARSTNGPYNWLEFGDPFDPTAYDYLRSYSPYETVRAQSYPMLFVTGGLQDQRVDYWSPAKWVAKVRDVKTDDNLLLLRTDMGLGHFGASGVQGTNRQTAGLYAFILMALGMEGGQRRRQRQPRRQRRPRRLGQRSGPRQSRPDCGRRHVPAPPCRRAVLPSSGMGGRLTWSGLISGAEDGGAA